MPVSRHDFAAVVLLLACACDPVSATGGADPATVSSSDAIEARRIARECVLACDEQHERGTAAHLGCARRCLAERQGIEREVAGEDGAHGSAPWTFVFAISVATALTLLAVMF